MTSLATGAFGAGGTAFDLTSISGAYNELWLYLSDWDTNYTADAYVALKLNNDTASNYLYYYTNATPALARTTGDTKMNLVEIFGSNSELGGWIRFPNYAIATGSKPVNWCLQGPTAYMFQGNGFYHGGAAISRITVTIGASQSFTGGNYALWGVK